MAVSALPEAGEEENRKKAIELQGLQQSIQLLAMQKQQAIVQAEELDTAITEVEKAKNEAAIYRAAGRILVQKDKAGLKKELEDEKEAVSVRKASIEKQEKKLLERFETLRKELEASLRNMDQAQGPKPN